MFGFGFDHESLLHSYNGRDNQRFDLKVVKLIYWWIFFRPSDPLHLREKQTSPPSDASIHIQCQLACYFHAVSLMVFPRSCRRQLLTERRRAWWQWGCLMWELESRRSQRDRAGWQAGHPHNEFSGESTFLLNTFKTVSCTSSLIKPPISSVAPARSTREINISVSALKLKTARSVLHYIMKTQRALCRETSGFCVISIYCIFTHLIWNKKCQKNWDSCDPLTVLNGKHTSNMTTTPWVTQWRQL